MLPDQTHQMSLVFGLSPALFHGDIYPSQVCIEVLSLPSAFEPQLWLWSPGLLLRCAWNWGPLGWNSHWCRPPASTRKTLPSSGLYLWLSPGVPVSLPTASHTHRTLCKVPPHCPSLRRWFPRAGTIPSDERVTWG